MKRLTMSLGNQSPPGGRTQRGLLRVGTRGTEGAAVIFLPPPMSTPTIHPRVAASAGMRWYLSRQSVPRGDRAALEGLTLPTLGHSKHKGLSSLSASLSSSGDSLPAGESVQSDKPLGPQWTALLGPQPSSQAVGISGCPGTGPGHLVQGLGLGVGGCWLPVLSLCEPLRRRKQKAELCPGARGTVYKAPLALKDLRMC